MSLGRHLEEAVTRLDAASLRIDVARAMPPTMTSFREWLVALTDYCRALSDIQRLNNESVHEKLHAISGHLGVERAL